MATWFRIFIILVIIACCASDYRKLGRLLKRTRQPSTSEATLCQEYTCGKYSYSYISWRFPGLFYSREEAKEKWTQFKTTRQNYLQKQDVHLPVGLLGDGDSCCETKVQTFINTTMKNIYGQKKFIVHMPPKYQFVPHGSCLRSGICDGQCVVEPVIQTILTFNSASLALEFDQFVVPGYCSCKAS
ncbi:uncharacterized protein LOC132718677 [Ruditapes philippinarum]|uniref:uncharacterized protein LOC132718677 n=1 Tax=Ruditapes philippinarum TaxID=129788 RepID=UPI00295B042D|nr:uncharacterized protein LOC132718677 [Ruditapes philippinarum]